MLADKWFRLAGSDPFLLVHLHTLSLRDTRCHLPPELPLGGAA